MPVAYLWQQKNKIYRQSGERFTLLGWLDHTRPGEEYQGWRVSTPTREREVVFPSWYDALDYLEGVGERDAAEDAEENPTAPCAP